MNATEAAERLGLIGNEHNDLDEMIPDGLAQRPARFTARNRAPVSS